MIRVPIYNNITKAHGTQFTFSTSNNDLTQYLASSSIKRSPSKFVCLQLPNWVNAASGREMFLDPTTLFGTTFGTSLDIHDPNQLVPAMMQNYMENMIAYAATEPVDVPKIAEIAFWKMLSRLGTTNFVASGAKYVDSLSGSLIKYIGDINIINNQDGVLLHKEK